jgi:poly-gamma-glutamate synthesis protein (capsule biosynthesis protein)
MPIPSKYWILGSIIVAVGVSSALVLLSVEHTYEEAPTKETHTEKLVPVAKLPPPPPIFFTGDVMLGRYVEQLIARGEVRPFDFMRIFATSTAVVTNFESAIALPHVPTPSGGMQFSTALASLRILEDLHITHASLANNHGRDYGESGYQNAIAQLTERNITPFGDPVRVSTSSLVYIPYGSEVIGIIGIHTLFNKPIAADLRPLMRQLAASSSVQLAYVHWGNEYELVHSQPQADLATLLVELGIDGIVGHHPHVTQDIAMVGGVPVFYSLGNFIFDQYFSPDVQEGLVLGLTVTPTNLEFTLHPHYQCARSTPCFMTASSAVSYLDALANRSEVSLRDQIRAQKLVIPR